MPKWHPQVNHPLPSGNTSIKGSQHPLGPLQTKDPQPWMRSATSSTSSVMPYPISTIGSWPTRKPREKSGQWLKTSANKLITLPARSTSCEPQNKSTLSDRLTKPQEPPRVQQGKGLQSHLPTPSDHGSVPRLLARMTKGSPYSTHQTSNPSSLLQRLGQLPSAPVPSLSARLGNLPAEPRVGH